MWRLFANFGFNRQYGIYSDESCQTAYRHMTIGAVSTSLSRVESVCTMIEAIRKESEFPGDSLQWKNITKRKLPDYEKLIDLATELISEHVIDFTCLVIDQKEVDHKRHNEGDTEIGFQKFLSELYLCYIRKYRKPPSLHCYHGQRDSRFELHEIRGILNSRAANRIRYNYLPFDILDYLDPSISDMHQLNDVLLGIISWHWNPGMRKLPDSPKSQIARKFRREIGYDLMHKATPPSARHIDVWKLRLR